MILINERLHNCHYVNSFLFSPFNKGFWDSFQNQQISNNFIKKIQKEEKVIMKLLNIKRFYYGNYLTLKDLDQDQNNSVFEYLKKLVPSVFQDGILNFDLLKQHLNSNEKIIQNTRNFLDPFQFWVDKSFKKLTPTNVGVFYPEMSSFKNGKKKPNKLHFKISCWVPKIT